MELHDDKEKQLTIHGSPEGLETFAKTLLNLVKHTEQGCFDHTHLMSEEWGSWELTSEPQSENAEIIHHVKIYCWKGDQFQK